MKYSIPAWSNFLDSHFAEQVTLLLCNDRSSPLLQHEETQLTTITQKHSCRHMTYESRSELKLSLSQNFQDLFDFATGQDQHDSWAGMAAGGNRNLALLLSGENISCLTDDDVLPEFHSLADFISEMGYNNAFLESDEQLTDWSKIVPAQTYKNLINDFCMSQHSRVLHFPYAGNSGALFPRFIYHARQNYYMEIESEAQYLSALQCNSVIRSGPDSFDLLGGHMWLKGTALSLPFLPRGRNSDGVWGFMARRLFKIERSEFAIRHAPHDRKTQAREQMVQELPGLPEIIMLLTGRLYNSGELKDVSSSTSASVPETVAEIGEALQSLCGDRNRFRSWTTELLAAALTSRRDAIDNCITMFNGEPFHWADDALDMYDFLDGKIKVIDPTAPLSLLGIEENNGIDYLKMYGKLLVQWDALRRAFRESVQT